MKEQKKGISLIVLVITIIVMLILASAVIISLSNSNIITKAQKASKDYTIVQEKEQISLGYSEYLMNKRTNANATLEVEGATVTDLKDRGWKIIFDKTNNIYEIDKEGILEISKEIVISEEKDIGGIIYGYQTQYNPNQPEIISAKGYYNDTDNDGMVDDNPSKPANIYGSYFNIKNTFFELDNFTGGNVEAKITHLDGSVEDIILTTTDNKVWAYEAESPLGRVERLYIEFRANAEYKSGAYNTWKASEQYHYMYIDGEVVVPFQKLEVLGETLEFPVTIWVQMGTTYNAEIYPMYEDINNVNMVTVNFLNGSKKVFSKEQLGTELLYEKGKFAMKDLSVSELENPITSVIVEENGIITKYNVTDSTVIEHTSPGS